MPFEIIIKETGTETKAVGGEWGNIDQTFMSEKDIANLSWMAKEKINSAEVKDLKKNVMGYLPKAERVVPFEKEVFRQTVNELDLTKVVKAVNNII